MNDNIGSNSSGNHVLRGISFKANVSWTAASNVVMAICQWGVIVVLARLGDAMMVGQFALALAITAPIATFFQFQLRGVQATDARQLFEFAEYLTVRIMTTVAALCVTFVVAKVADFESELAIVVMLVALGKSVDALSDVFYGAFQQQERMDIIARGTMITGVLLFALFALILLATGNLVMAVAGYIMAPVMTFLLYVIPIGARTLSARNQPWLKWELSRIRMLVRLVLPLGFVILFLSLSTNIPRMVIERDLGTASLGVFAALSYLIVAGNTIVSALGQSASPRLAKLFAEHRFGEFRSMLKKLIGAGIAISFAGALLSIVAGPSILSFLYGAEYAKHVKILIALAIVSGVIFAATFAGYGLTATRTFDLQMFISAAALVVSLAASFVLIPIYGLLGAVCALAISAFVQLTLLILAIRGKLNRAAQNSKSRDLSRDKRFGSEVVLGIEVSEEFSFPDQRT